MVLDHLIASVQDIQASHRRLRAMGFDEAWPPGPFWPNATTSGIALGGANLELYQSDDNPSGSQITTLVLAPESLAEATDFLRPFRYDQRQKIESNRDLLTRRGFPRAMVDAPQEICTNLNPENPPYPFFLCLYSPFLKARLAPANFASPRGPLVGLSLRAPEPEAARRLFAGHLGPLELDVDPGPPQVVEILFSDGSSLAAKDL